MQFSLDLPTPKWANGLIRPWIRDFAEQGAIDATAPYRDGSRLVQAEGGTYLRPTDHCILVNL